MYNISLQDFLKLSRGANVIPVYKEINADLDTPVSCFLKLAKDKYSFLLESVEGQEKIARYSFLGTNPCIVLSSKGKHIEIRDHGVVRRFVTDTDPLDEIRKIMRGFKPAAIKGLPRFYGGFVGYIGYDFVRFIEDIPDKNPDDLRIPDAFVILTDKILLFDHINHTLKIIVNVILPPEGKGLSRDQKARRYRLALKQIEAIDKDFKRSVRAQELEPVSRGKRTVLTSNFEKSQFCGIVNKAKEHIKAGDIIQVVLSQRFKAKIKREPFDIYRSLRGLNPSPYMFFLQLGPVTLIGASPELLVRCENGAVQVRPIAGTRRRGRTEAEDKSLEEELLNDPKEKAEHLMLVDLGRNDVGRIAKLGSVKVNNFMSVEKYSHVMHLVSEVAGVLDTKYDAYDVLRACFPAGTVSGSPKVRAMEIIDELENTRRSTYAGCVGYVSFSGNLDTCITLRTMAVIGDTAYIQAGAGIVADSVPEREFVETQNKAKALIEALNN
ncbi:MAG: anthranilate synthase component I [Candidatus Omnitrophota bacterium]